MNLRDATVADLPAIVDIYNYEVANSTATFDTIAVTVDERTAWLARHRETPRHPVLVVQADGGAVAGWAALSAWSDRCAYARAAEVSVYVHRDHRGKGIGRQLLMALIERGRAAGLGVLLARISMDGDASVKLHESLGFGRIGTMRRVGEKFGRILDVDVFELHLDGG